jgi:hypothetical protein
MFNVLVFECGPIPPGNQAVALLNSLIAMGARERPPFNELYGTVVSRQIFIHSV